jgi:hypothetical protein
LKSGWVEAIAKEYQDEPQKPFLGDFVNVEGVIPHCSGVCVNPGIVIDHAPAAVMAFDMAWDCYASDQIVPRMKQTQLIRHSWKHPPFNNQSEVDNLIGQLGDAVLFHADKSGTLIDLLREREGIKPAVPLGMPILNAVAGRTEPAKPNIDILIKTYEKDYEWLKYCLRSIDKFVTGVRRVWVLTPQKAWCPKTTVIPCQVVEVEEYKHDAYLSQQLFKIQADTFSDADWILHIDSDTIFTRPVTPETYLKDAKYVWMMTPMDQAHPDQQQSWRKVMEKFVGKPPTFEFMRRFPFMFPRWLYAEFRKFCEVQHQVGIERYVMDQPYREFSEFNAIGFYAYEYWKDKFEWIDTSKHPESEWPVLTVDQRWSHSEIPVQEWETILGGAKAQVGVAAAAQPDPAPTLTSSTGNGQTLTLVMPPTEGHMASWDIASKTWEFCDPMEVIKARFTSPLAKGRIIKALKAAPIIKIT